MIIKSRIIADLILDCHKLKPFMEGSTLKNQNIQTASELDADRHTVDNYINGFHKSKTQRENCITNFYDIITELLSDNGQQILFYYKRVLWQYLVDNHSYEGSYVNFCHYLRKYPELELYFKKPNHQT